MTHETMLSFDAFSRHWAAEKPDEVALEEGEKQATFAELDRGTGQAIALLGEMGVTRGGRVARQGKNPKI